MKFAISTAVLLVLGANVSAYAGQEKGQEDHSQDAKSTQQQAKPAQQQHAQTQAKPAQQQQHAQTQAKPAQQQHAQTQAKPAQQQHAQTQAKPAQQQHAQTPAKPAQQSSPAHGRISNAHYASSFGSGHSFHVSQGDYQNRRFQYGGYSFGFIDPWPSDWGYSDDVYIVYVDGGYYMYDVAHPGVRIAVSIF
jgi:FKBP-type peptidyl-prolyl cis-trans isomerase